MSPVRLVLLALTAAIAVLLGASLLREYVTKARAPSTPLTGTEASPTAPNAAAQNAVEQPAVAAKAADGKGGDGKGGDSKGPVPPAAGNAAAPVASARAPAAAPVAAAGPAFDVVRVEPDGAAVIAGRAPAGATVELLRGGVVHDRVVADSSGLFAMTPPALPPGEHELTLRFTAPDGSQSVAAQAVTVGIAADKRTRPMIAVTTPGAATVVLSKPDAAPPSAASSTAAASAGAASTVVSSATVPPKAQEPSVAAPARPGGPVQVAIDAVEAEEGGKLYVSGRALPGATLRLYLNDTYLASGAAGTDGRVTFSIAGGVTSGDYKVRLDDTDPVTGKVKSRAEVPFAAPVQVAAAMPAPAAGPRPASGQTGGQGDAVSPAPARPSSVQASSAQPPAAPLEGSPSKGSAPAVSPSANVVQVPEVKTTQVVRGDSLWRISRRVYGHGVRYTVIYGANDAQIRNPNLIYPGQVFVLPGQDG